MRLVPSKRTHIEMLFRNLSVVGIFLLFVEQVCVRACTCVCVTCVCVWASVCESVNMQVYVYVCVGVGKSV